jgi:predicted dinucleotide-binding enzyme
MIMNIGIIGAGAIGSAFARALVAALIDRLGSFGIDLGSLAGGGRLVQFPGGSLPGHNLVKFG